MTRSLWELWTLVSALALMVALPLHASHPSSICTAAGLTGGALGLCETYCDTLDCTAPENAGSGACTAIQSQYLAATGEAFPCERTDCELLEPALLFERISLIHNPEYICYADQGTPYEYVEYIVRSEGVPQIGLGMEDQFDGTWYGYYFEYQSGAPGALPEFYRYDLTPEQVEECRQAFEPPFDCTQ